MREGDEIQEEPTTQSCISSCVLYVNICVGVPGGC